MNLLPEQIQAFLLACLYVGAALLAGHWVPALILWILAFRSVGNAMYYGV